MKMLLPIYILFITNFALAQDRTSGALFDGKRYYNQATVKELGFWAMLRWKWENGPETWEPDTTNKNFPRAVYTPDIKGALTFINHSTFLIQLNGLNILTDPIFSERAGPFKFLGPKRAHPPGLKIEELPSVDVVLVSHNHYDHLDLESLKQIDGRFHPMFLVPKGNEKFLKEAGIQNVTEMDWWQEFKIKDATITFTPARHWSARGLFDKFETLWGSFYITNPATKIYFAGDTGYSKHFTTIREKLGAPDVALLPIGAYEPRWFMEEFHLRPEEAVFAHQDLQSKYSIGMHFGTFQLGDEGRMQPVAELEIACAKWDVDLDFFVVLSPGESKIY